MILVLAKLGLTLVVGSIEKNVSILKVVRVRVVVDVHLLIRFRQVNENVCVRCERYVPQ